MPLDSPIHNLRGIPRFNPAETCSKVPSEPEALLAVLRNPAYHFKRIGLEAGPLSQWLYSALAEAELPVVCVETRHMQALLKAQINTRQFRPCPYTCDGSR